MFTDTTQRPEITPEIVDALAIQLTDYITTYITQGMMADTDGTVFDMAMFPYLIRHMLEEPMDGCISGGFIGYLFGKGYNVKQVCGNVPRAQALASMQVLERFPDLPDIVKYLDDAKAAQSEYEAELNKEIPDNVTPILH